MTSPDSRSLPNKRIWVEVFIAIALALVAAGYWYYRIEMAHVLHENYQQVSAIAQLKSGQIQRWRKERQLDAKRLVSSGYLQRTFRSFLLTRDDPAPRATLQQRLEIERVAGEYANVILFAPDGSFLLGAGTNSHQHDPALAATLQAALTNQEPVFSQFCETCVDVATGVTDAEGKRLGVALLCSDPQPYLYDLIQKWPTLSPSAETVLVQRDGEEVLFVNTLRHATNLPATLRFPLSRTNLPAVQAVLGRTGQCVGEDYRGVPVLTDLKPIPGSPWYLVAKVDLAEILSEVRYRAVMGGLIIGSLILLAAAVIAYFYRRQQVGLFQQLYTTERRQRESLAVFRAALYSIGDAVITTEVDGRVRTMNRVAERLTGWTEAEAQRRPLKEVFRIVEEDRQTAVTAPVEEVVRQGTAVGVPDHTLLLSREGKEYRIVASAAPIGDANTPPLGVVLVFNDQTLRYAMQLELAKINRTLRLISNCHSTLIRATDETDLLQEICRIVKEQGGYVTAWVGFAQDDAEKSVRIVAEAGAAAGVIEQLQISWADELRGRGPSGTAIRTRKPCMTQDVLTDPKIAPWKHLSPQAPGVSRSSVCALPLLGAERAFGTLTVYSGELEPFTAEEIALLQSLADDLSFGILSLRTKAAHRESLAALAQSEARNRNLVEHAPYCIHEIDLNGCLAHMNPAGLRMLSLPDESAIRGKRYLDCVGPADAEHVGQLLARALVGEAAEFEFTATTGQIFQSAFVPMLDAGGKVVRLMGLTQEITARRRAEEALRFTQYSMERAGDAICWLKPDGSLLRVNEAMCRLFGYAREELLARKIFDLNPDFPQASWAEHWRDLKQKKALTFEVLGCTKAGHRIAVEVAANYLEFEGAEFNCAFVRDLTERKRAEARLLAFSRLGNLLSLATDPAIAARAVTDTALELWNWDASFVLIYDPVSRKYREVVSMDTVNNVRVPATIESENLTLTPLLQRVIDEGPQLILRQDDSDTGQTTERFGDHNRPSLSLMYAALRHGGQVVGFLSVQSYQLNAFTPVDLETLQALANHCASAIARLQAEVALRESEARYRTLYNQSSDGIVVVSAEGKLVTVNEAFAAMHGYTVPEMLGLSLATLDSPEAARQLPERIRRILAGETLTFEVENYHKDRHLFPLEVTARKVSIEGNHFIQSTCRDITERKRAQEALRKHVEELAARNAILDRFNRATVGRELRMIELKREVNELCAKLGEPLPYKTPDDAPPPTATTPRTP